MIYEIKYGLEDVALRDEIKILKSYLVHKRRNHTPDEIQEYRLALASYSYDYLESTMDLMSLSMIDKEVALNRMEGELMASSALLAAKRQITSNRESYDLARKILFQDEEYSKLYSDYHATRNRYFLDKELMKKVDQICNALK